MIETKQKLSTQETVRRAMRLAHRLTADDYRAILQTMPTKSKANAVRRAVLAVEMSRIDDVKGARKRAFFRGVLPPEEFDDLADSLKEPSVSRVVGGEAGSIIGVLMVLSALFWILAVVFLGMSIAGNMHPAAIALSAALAVIAHRACFAKLSTVDVLLDPGMYRAWRVLYAAVLHQAIRAGELEEPRSWGRGKAGDLRAAWDAAGLSWDLVSSTSVPAS